MSKKSEASKKKEVEQRRLRYGLGSVYGPGDSGNGTTGGPGNITGQQSSIGPGREKISIEIGGARPGKGKFDLSASVKKNLFSGSSSKDRAKFQAIKDSVMKTIH